MQNVAADRHDKPLNAPLVAADRQGVEQRLRGVLMTAIPGVDHAARDLSRQKMHGAGMLMAHHDYVGPHRVQRYRRINKSLALAHRRSGDRHVHDVGAKPLARQLEGGLRAGGGFKEKIDLRAPA